MEKIVLENKDISVSVLPYGAIIQDIRFKGNGIALSLPCEEAYIADTCCFGSAVGRTANRTGEINYIDGKEYHLPLNENGINHLHGGYEGFGKKRFSVIRQSCDSVLLSYFSADGEEGYPGNLDVDITYSLLPDGLMINYRAETDAPTWVSLTNHTYFNPEGFYGGDIFGVPVCIRAGEVSEYDENMRVIGRRSVSGSIFDLRAARPIDREYDHNYYLDGMEKRTFGKKTLALAAEVFGSTNISVYTDMPCIQFYTGNFIPEGTLLKNGSTAGKHSALCLETQYEPNFQSKGENILRPGEIYDKTTVFCFS